MISNWKLNPKAREKERRLEERILIDFLDTSIHILLIAAAAAAAAAPPLMFFESGSHQKSNTTLLILILILTLIYRQTN